MDTEAAGDWRGRVMHIRPWQLYTTDTFAIQFTAAAADEDETTNLRLLQFACSYQWRGKV
jgi:hypothetical protein